MILATVIVLILAVAIAVFAAQNAVPLVVTFFNWEVTTSLAVIILASAAAGAIVVALLSLFRQIAAGLRHLELQSKMRKMERDGAQLSEQVETLKEECERLRAQLVLARRAGGEDVGVEASPSSAESCEREDQGAPQADDKSDR